MPGCSALARFCCMALTAMAAVAELERPRGAGAHMCGKTKVWTSLHAGSLAYDCSAGDAGARRLVAGDVDFTFTDSPEQLLDDAAAAGVDIGIIPIEPAPISIVVNCPQLPVLRLSRRTLVGIFSGAIRMWNDAALMADNPSILPSTFPNATLTVVVAEDARGTTRALTEALASFGWDGGGAASSFPEGGPFASFVRRKSVADVLDEVRGMRYSLGYAPDGDTRTSELRRAAVIDRMGYRRMPVARDVKLALSVVDVDARGVATGIVDALGYPLMGLVYLAYRPGMSGALWCDLVDMVWWVYRSDVVVPAWLKHHGTRSLTTASESPCGTRGTIPVQLIADDHVARIVEGDAWTRLSGEGEYYVSNTRPPVQPNAVGAQFEPAPGTPVAGFTYVVPIALQAAGLLANIDAYDTDIFVAFDTLRALLAHELSWRSAGLSPATPTVTVITDVVGNATIYPLLLSRLGLDTSRHPPDRVHTTWAAAVEDAHRTPGALLVRDAASLCAYGLPHLRVAGVPVLPLESCAASTVEVRHRFDPATMNLRTEINGIPMDPQPFVWSVVAYATPPDVGDLVQAAGGDAATDVPSRGAAVLQRSGGFGSGRKRRRPIESAHTCGSIYFAVLWVNAMLRNGDVPWGRMPPFLLVREEYDCTVRWAVPLWQGDSDTTAAITVSIVVAWVLLMAAGFLLRMRHVRYAPTGPAAAVVFTDIQSSAELWETNSNAMRRALDAHNRICRSHIRPSRGYEVKSIGDAFMVMFVDPLDAVSWAFDVQTALFAHEWSSELLTTPAARREEGFNGLRVRMGMHYGRVDVVRSGFGYDYAGVTINRAARVANAPAGGQVVMTGALYDRVDASLDQLARGADVKYLGAFTFHGVPDPVDVIQIMPTDLGLHRRSFPTLRSAVPLADGRASVDAGARSTEIHWCEAMQRIRHHHADTGCTAPNFAATLIKGTADAFSVEERLQVLVEAAIASTAASPGRVVEDGVSSASGSDDGAAPHALVPADAEYSWQQAAAVLRALPRRYVVSIAAQLAREDAPSPRELADDDKAGVTGSNPNPLARQPREAPTTAAAATRRGRSQQAFCVG